jgi:hypothetical protein
MSHNFTPTSTWLRSIFAAATAVRVALFCAAVISTSLTFGSVLALADHYSGTAQQAAAPATVVALR